MIKISKWFKRPIKLSDREQYIFNIIELMLNKEDSEVRIDPDNMDYYINNKTTLGFTAKGIYSPTHIGRYNYAYLLDPDLSLNSNVIADNKDVNELINGTFNLNLRYQIDSLGKEITFNADHIRYNVNLKQIFKNDVIIADGTNVYSDSQTGNLLSGINSTLGPSAQRSRQPDEQARVTLASPRSSSAVLSALTISSLPFWAQDPFGLPSSRRFVQTKR